MLRDEIQPVWGIPNKVIWQIADKIAAIYKISAENHRGLQILIIS